MLILALDGRLLGTVEEVGGFGPSKRLQEASLPPELVEAYAGLSSSGLPIFYDDLLTEAGHKILIDVGYWKD